MGVSRASLEETSWPAKVVQFSRSILIRGFPSFEGAVVTVVGVGARVRS